MPRDAASLILVDRSGREPRFLMGRRHDGHAFMPGRMVFPGGRIDPADRVMRAHGALSPLSERGLMAKVPRPTPAKARALALCAIRETAEETGLLVGETGLGSPATAPAAWAPFLTHAVYPNLEALHFVARAITPPAFPRRFDARFFVADASTVALRLDGAVGPEAELVSLKWLTCDEAAGENLADITRMILDAAKRRLDLGLEADHPVPFFRERSRVWGREDLR